MGRYAIILILAFSFSILIYNQGNRTIHTASNYSVIDQYSINQAKNIAESASLFLIKKMIENENDAFVPDSNQTISSPSNLNEFESWNLMEGAFRYDIVNIEDSLITLTTTAKFGDNTYEMAVFFDYTASDWDPDLTKAVFTENGIELGGSARIKGHAGTNSTDFQAIKLAWSTKIDSSLVIGPGGDISTTVHESNFQNGNVGLTTTNLPAPKSHKLPDFPEFPSNTLLKSNIIISGGGTPPPLMPTDFDGFYIPILRITGNNSINIMVGSVDRVLHVGELDIQQGHINIIGDGNLTIYVEDEITLGGSSTINNNRTSNTMFTYYKGTNDIDFGGSTSWTGGMYAETADINMNGSGGIKGNIITGGENVTISGNSEANSRAIFAPNAMVTMTGSGRVKGAIVAQKFKATGATYVQFSEELGDEFPDFKGGEKKLVIRNWR